MIKKSSLLIALTGGIGSGKTTAANEFKKLGAPVIDADEISREVVQRESPLLQKISDYFGHDILNDDHTLNRKKLKHIIFQDNEKRKWLEQQLHPKIYEIMQECANQINAPYVLLVIPLFFESPPDFSVDRVLTINTSFDLRKERIKKRDELDETTISAIMATQIPEYTADDIIQNDGDLDAHQDRVKTLHNQYLSLSQA